MLNYSLCIGQLPEDEKKIWMLNNYDIIQNGCTISVQFDTLMRCQQQSNCQVDMLLLTVIWTTDKANITNACMLLKQVNIWATFPPMIITRFWIKTNTRENNFENWKLLHHGENNYTSCYNVLPFNYNIHDLFMCPNVLGLSIDLLI